MRKKLGKKKFRTWDNYSNPSCSSDEEEEYDQQIKQKHVPSQYKKMNNVSFKEAARIVLFNSGKSMTVKEIWDEMVTSLYFQTNGKTPTNSLNMILHKEIRDNKENVMFQKTGVGEFKIVL